MEIYLLVIFCCLVCTYLYDLKKMIVGYDMTFWGICFLLIVVAGMRYQIGADTINYMDNFRYVKDLSKLSVQDFSDTRYMPGWIIFASACKSLNSQLIGLQFVHAIILNVSIFLFIKTFAQYRFTAVLMYVLLAYINLNTEILRESLAMSVFLLAIVAFVRNKWFIYLIVCFCTSMIHVSGFISFLFPIGKLLKISSRKRIVILSLFLFVISSGIWTFFQAQIVDFFVLGAIEEGAEAYLNSEYTYNISGIIVNLTTRCVIPLVAIYYALKFNNKSYKLLPLAYIYVILGFFIMFNSVIFLRFQTYVTIPFIILLSDTLVSLIKQHKLAIVTILLIGIIVPYYYTYFKPETFVENVNLKDYVYQRYVPYQIWPEHNNMLLY